MVYLIGFYMFQRSFWLGPSRCCITSHSLGQLSRTFLKIVYSEALRVLPWSSTFRCHMRSKKILSFESSYMTSYLTSIDTLSISYRFRDIRLQSFEGMTLTFDLQRSPKDKHISPFESSFVTSYLTSIDPFSLSRTVFEIFDFKFFRGWPLTFSGHLGWKTICHLKPHTWLPSLIQLTLSISYCFRDNRFPGVDLDLEPLKVT